MSELWLTEFIGAFGTAFTAFFGGFATFFWNVVSGWFGV